MNFYICLDICDDFRIYAKEDKMRSLVWDTFSGAKMKFFKYSEEIAVVRIETQVNARKLIANKMIPYLSIKLEDGRDMFKILNKGLDGFSGHGEYLIRTLFPQNSEMSKAKCLWGRSTEKFFFGMSESDHYCGLKYHVIFFNIICTESDYYFKFRY